MPCTARSTSVYGLYASVPMQVPDLPLSAAPPVLTALYTDARGREASNEVPLVAAQTGAGFDLASRASICARDVPGSTSCVYLDAWESCSARTRATFTFDLVAPADWPAELTQWPTVELDYVEPEGDTVPIDLCLWSDWCVVLYPPG